MDVCSRDVECDRATSEILSQDLKWQYSALLHRLLFFASFTATYTQLCRPQIHFALIKASDVKFVFQVVIQSFYVDVKVSEYSDGDKKGTMGKKKKMSWSQTTVLPF